jgi:hypothetical protein
MFEDSFVGYLLDLVEQTGGMEDETFNHSVIKLIVGFQIPLILAFLKPLTGGLKRTVYGSPASRQYT